MFSKTKFLITNIIVFVSSKINNNQDFSDNIEIKKMTENIKLYQHFKYENHMFIFITTWGVN